MSSDVYFIKDKFDEKIPEILKKLCPNFSKVGIKVHFGEEGNVTYLPPKYVKIVSDCFNSTLIETNVLYKGKRTETKDHLETAKNHGFDFAPIKILDQEEEIEINEKHFKKAYLGKNPFKNLIVASHFKGHILTGLGGSIKNIGMGMASRKGKLALHSSVAPSIIKEKCISCSKCISHCPVNAIKIKDKAGIDPEICIGCAECIAVCPEGAVNIPWSSLGSEEVQERIVEYCKAELKDKNVVYINFLMNLTKHCDCMGEKYRILGKDIGVLISKDIVAIDKASYDLCKEKGIDFSKINGVDSLVQVKYGENIGLGNSKYNLIEI
jgi:uncharacterized Fe-S center protein